MRCQCPKASVDHQLGLCLNEASVVVLRGKVDPVELSLCVMCTLAGDVPFGEQDWVDA